LAVVIALLGARGLTSDSGDANEPKPATQKPAEKTAAAATSTAQAADSEWARCDARLVGPIAEFENVYGKKPRPLIALVPDPIDSGLAYYFDAVLEGIEAAVGDGVVENGKKSAWVRDRYWLPWHDLDQTQTTQKTTCRTTHPGVVLYREGKRGDRGLAVLLVGETQTWGVRPAALDRAVSLAMALDPLRLKGGDGSERPLLDVVGPTFSGTASSLAALLQRFPANPDGTPPSVVPSYRVRSGTATAPSVVSTLSKASIDYASAISSDTALSDALYCRLSQSLRVPVVDGRLQGVALFSEGGTAYGAGFQAPRGKAPCAGPEFAYVFPNLVDVRAAWGRLPASTIAEGPRFALELGDARDPLARVHTVLSSFTPVGRDISLSAALSELSIQAVQYVGIVATDVNDVVFLASRVKKQLKDVRLFTMGSDIVLLHPDNAVTLSGMLVAHSELTSPTATTQRLDVGTREMVQGVYLATHSLLTGNRPVASRARVSVVSRNKLWGVDPKHDRSIAAIGTASPDLVPASFSLFGALWGVFALLNIGAFLAQAYYPPARSHWTPLPLRALRPCRGLEFRAAHTVRSFHLLSCIALPTLFVAVLLHRAQPFTTNPVPYGCVVAETVVVIGGWMIALVRAAKHGLGSHVDVLDRVNVLVSVALGIFLLTGAAYWANEAPLARTVALGSGASPLLPVLFGCGILYVIALTGLVRIRLLDARAPAAASDPTGIGGIAPALGWNGETKGRGYDVQELERRLFQSLLNPWTLAPGPVALAAAVLAGGIGFVFATKPLLTLERTGWHALLVAVVFGCMIAQFATYARLCVYFLQLRMLLRRVAVHPIVEPLRHLTPMLARSVESQLLLSRAEAHDLAEPVRLLGALGRSRPADAELGPDLAGLPSSKDIQEWYESAAATLESELALVAERRVPGPAALELRAVMFRAGARLASGLAPLWDRSVRLSGFDDASSEHGEKDVLGSLTGPVRQWVSAAEALVAALVALHLERYVRHFRYFALALVSTAVLFVPLTAFYAFQPQSLLLSLGLVATTVTVGTVLGMYFALDRDAVLSAIASTTAGELTVNSALVTRVVGWGVIPMASVIAAQYPEFTQWVLSAIGPVGGAFK
jgi:hypothetical protein